MGLHGIGHGAKMKYSREPSLEDTCKQRPKSKPTSGLAANQRAITKRQELIEMGPCMH